MDKEAFEALCEGDKVRLPQERVAAPYTVATRNGNVVVASRTVLIPSQGVFEAEWFAPANTELSDLRSGDVIVSRASEQTYVVTFAGKEGPHRVVMATKDITLETAESWEVLALARQLPLVIVTGKEGRFHAQFQGSHQSQSGSTMSEAVGNLFLNDRDFIRVHSVYKSN